MKKATTPRETGDDVGCGEKPLGEILSSLDYAVALSQAPQEIVRHPNPGAWSKGLEKRCPQFCEQGAVVGWFCRHSCLKPAVETCGFAGAISKRSSTFNEP